MNQRVVRARVAQRADDRGRHRADVRAPWPRISASSRTPPALMPLELGARARGDRPAERRLADAGRPRRKLRIAPAGEPSLGRPF